MTIAEMGSELRAGQPGNGFQAQCLGSQTPAGSLRLSLFFWCYEILVLSLN